MPRFRYPFDDKLIPMNGIYFLFEKDEIGHDVDRIVQVGSHTGMNQLRSRLQQHFVNPSKDRSILRKNIGRCLLHQTMDRYLKVWDLDCTSLANKAKYGSQIDTVYQQTIEKKVSEYIQNNFSFCVLEVPSKEERKYLKSKIVSTVATCQECIPSDHWLGMSSPNSKIQDNGLWQVNELFNEPLDQYNLQRLVELR
ncbi:hypothetical protein CFI03_006920 [Paenibacillus sp. ATY16]|nr:hypothetical protein [Paenibacillus sp. ATY16]